MLAVSLFGRRWTATPSSERETETETFGKEKDRCACLLLLRRFFEVLRAMIFWVFVKSVLSPKESRRIVVHSKFLYYLYSFCVF